MFVTPASMVVALAFRDWVQFADQKKRKFQQFPKKAKSLHDSAATLFRNN
jgi:hypothetical protein